ncbi:MAG: tetratricopeptide repeat protein, partial [Nitrospirae bacterium]|nr:tetratricopeptide repeat protein [Nitrospirota bacterium]
MSYFKADTEFNPQNGDKFRWLGAAYYRNGQYQEAIDACKKSLNLPHNGFAWESWDFMSLAYSALGQIDSAISARKKSIELKPDNSDSFVTLARLYRENKQYDEAITAAKRAIELKPDNDSAYISLGFAYGVKKQYDEAIKALKKSIEINPKDSTNYDLMGHFLMEKNAYNEAVEAYKKGIEAAASNPDLRESLAIAYYRMGRYDDAIAFVNKAIELQTSTGIGINYAIESGYPVVKEVMEAGPAKKAGILAGDKIIKIEGKSIWSTINGFTEEIVTQKLRGALGTEVSLTIERKGAEKTIDKTVTRETIITKKAALSFGLRSLAYRYKGSLEAALTDAEKAYSLDSANGWAQLSLGASYLDRGKYDESIKLLSQIKVSLIARILEATTYAKQGKIKLAVNFYFSTMDAYPEEAISPKNIPLMNDRMALLQTFKPVVKEHRDKARSFEAKGQYKEALSALSEALKIADDTEAQAIQESIFSVMRR